MKFFYFLIIFLMTTANSLAFSSEDYDTKAAHLNSSAIEKVYSNQLDDAEIDLLKALAYSNEHPKIRENLGKVYHEKGVQSLNKAGGEYEAIRYLKKALEIEPNNEFYRKSYSTALYNMALKKGKQGSVAEAIDYYERAGSFRPNDVRIWTAASDYAWSTHNKAAAEMFYSRARDLDPLNNNVQILERKLSDFQGDAEDEVIRSEHFNIVGAPQRIGGIQISGILKEMEYALDQILYELNISFRDRITVIFYPPDQFHYKFDIPDYVIGLYDGKVRLPYPDSEHALKIMYPSLKHELSHAVMYAHSKGKSPKWLDEGVAQVMEGKEITREHLQLMYDYEIGLPMPSVVELKDHILRRNRWAYLKAQSFTLFLIKKYGLNSIIRCVDQGYTLTFEECFEEVTNLDLFELEDQWRKSLLDLE